MEYLVLILPLGFTLVTCVVAWVFWRLGRIGRCEECYKRGCNDGWRDRILFLMSDLE